MLLGKQERSGQEHRKMPDFKNTFIAQWHSYYKAENFILRYSLIEQSGLPCLQNFCTQCSFAANFTLFHLNN